MPLRLPDLRETSNLKRSRRFSCNFEGHGFKPHPRHMHVCWTTIRNSILFSDFNGFLLDPGPYHLIRIRIPDSAQLLIRIRIRNTDRYITKYTITPFYLALSTRLAWLGYPWWQGEPALHAGSNRAPVRGGGAAEALLGCAGRLVVRPRLVHENVGVPVALPLLR